MSTNRTETATTPGPDPGPRLGAAGLQKEAKDAQKDVQLIRRKSKDLEKEISAIMDMAAAADGWRALRGSRRSSRDYSDEALMEAFKEMDTDGSGSIEQDELRNAILKMNPFESEKNIKEMMDYADEDGDGHVDFEEFKKIMLYKKPKEAPPSFGSG